MSLHWYEVSFEWKVCIILVILKVFIYIQYFNLSLRVICEQGISLYLRKKILFMNKNHFLFELYTIIPSYTVLCIISDLPRYIYLIEKKKKKFHCIAFRQRYFRLKESTPRFQKVRKNSFRVIVREYACVQSASLR